MSINVDQALLERVAVHENLSQEIIVISSDKVQLLLIEHHRVFKKKSDWVAPVGIFLTILATILTAKFETNRFGVPADVWQGLFVLGGVITLVWSIVVIVNVIACRNKATVEEFILKLRNNSKG